MIGTFRLITAGQREQLANRMIPGDLTADEAQKIIESPKTSPFDRRVADAFGSIRFNPNCFSLVVDYGEKLEDQARMGEYGYVHRNFTSANFPTTRTGTVTLEGGRLVHFGCDMSTEAVEKKLDEMGLRPGDAHELCAFGSTFPEEQRKCPIVALGGKRWRDPVIDECVAVLGGWNVTRKLYLNTVAADWIGVYRFLAFPK